MEHDRPRSAAPARGAFERIRFVDALRRNVDPHATRRIPAGCGLYVRGWIRSPSGGPITALRLHLGDEFTIPLASDESTADLRQRDAGRISDDVAFRDVVSLIGLPRGAYALRLAAIAADGATYVLDPGESFAIVGTRPLFPGQRPAAPGTLQIAIDDVETYGGTKPDDGLLIVRPGETIAIRGWAIDREAATSSPGIFALVDGKEYVVGVHGLARHDVALAHDIFGAKRCGFTIRIQTRGLRPGAHTIDVVALAADGVTYASTACASILLGDFALEPNR